MIWKRTRQRDVVLNGEHPDAATVAALAVAVQDYKILVAKGGYIFKAALSDDVLHLGLIPTVMGDTRNVHHAIRLAVDAPVLASGFINTDSSFALVLLKPGAAPMLLDSDRPLARQLVARLCRCLLDWGVSEGLPLDFTTQLTLQETGISTAAPDTLGELLQTVDTDFAGW